MKHDLQPVSFVHKYNQNPIFTADSVPYPSTLAFNGGVAFYNGQYVMAFRNDVCMADNFWQVRDVATGIAVSDNGLDDWDVKPEPARIWYKGKALRWCNDARLTVLDNQLYLCFVFTGKHGQRPGIAIARENLLDYDVICLGVPNQRNMVLFPEKINGKYWRFERPSIHRGDIWISNSPDLEYWGNQEIVITRDDVEDCNVKVGAGAPPIRTDAGWLVIYHAVDSDPARTVHYGSFAWDRRYITRAALLKLDDPTCLKAILPEPLFIADQDYETGNTEKYFRENVVFATGACLDGDRLRVYYGAGDLHQCVAEMELSSLLSAMTPATRKDEYATRSSCSLPPILTTEVASWD